MRKINADELVERELKRQAWAEISDPIVIMRSGCIVSGLVLYLIFLQCKSLFPGLIDFFVPAGNYSNWWVTLRILLPFVVFYIPAFYFWPKIERLSDKRFDAAYLRLKAEYEASN